MAEGARQVLGVEVLVARVAETLPHEMVVSMGALESKTMRGVFCACPTLALVIITAAADPAVAQDMQPDPTDVEAVKALLQKATRAMISKDQKTFVACCDDYVDCFFLDGTLIKGKKRIAATLYEFFRQRPEDLVVKLDVVPRSYRALSPEILTVDWPATIAGPNGAVKVNTLITVRKQKGQWLITSYSESVPYTGRVGGRNAVPGKP